ncbi:MAG: hypothetical protein KDI36_08780 [Pseudomonadales bacterium]|nr:hypothetical protein [Pseudomonadales bacterium]
MWTAAQPSQKVQRRPMGKGDFYLVLISAIIVAELGVFGVILLSQGWNEDASLLFTRYSARLSFMFFLPVFIASAAWQLVPNGFSGFLLRRRRQLGLGFAFAHFIHLVAIVGFLQQQRQWFTAEDIPALLIYLLIGLMAITSNTPGLRLLGKGWKPLHKVGMYGAFSGFFLTYLGRLGSEQVSLPADAARYESYETYLVLLMVATGAWMLRIAAFWQRRARQRSVTPAAS